MKLKKNPQRPTKGIELIEPEQDERFYKSYEKRYELLKELIEKGLDPKEALKLYDLKLFMDKEKEKYYEKLKAVAEKQTMDKVT